MGKTCNRPWLHYQTNRVKADIFDLGACASYCGRLDADAVHMHDAVGWWSGTCSDGSVARLKMVNDGSRCMGKQAGFRDVHWKRFCGLQPMGKEKSKPDAMAPAAWNQQATPRAFVEGTAASPIRALRT